MKLRTKRIAALGMSTMMMSSMAIGVQAAETVNVNNNAKGETTVSGSADVAVDGWINGTADDSSKSSYDQSQSNGPQSSGAPGGTNQPTTSWGDDSTKDTTQLIITAPTKLTFMAKGTGSNAKLVAQNSLNTNVEGEIVNQSCYVQSDLSVVPKKVKVSGKTTLGNEQEFALKAASNTNYVEGVKLYVGDTGTEFGNTVNNETELGTLAAGTVAYTSNDKQAVNGSKTKVFFSGSSKDDKSVTTGFSDSYETNKNIHSDYTLGLKYAVN